jgi:hypothetical protein
VRAVIEQLSRPVISKLIADNISSRFNASEVALFNACVMRSTAMWVGFIDGVLACVWGLVPPTLLSEQAYLWLHHTDTIKGHEFLFIRRSQIAVADMLLIHPLIVGHAEVGNARGIKWLKWLGAVFGEPEGRLIPFTIRGKHD